MDQGTVFTPNPPVENEIVLPVTTTAFVVKVPDAWKGKVLEVTPHGASVALRFGTSTTVTVDYTATATIDATTKVITVAATSGRRFVDGYPRLVRCPTGNYDYLGIDASGTGVLSINVAGEG